MNTEMKPKDAMRALECCCINQDCYGCPMFSEEPIADCNYYVMSCALALLREKDTEIERLNKEIDRLSQVVLYHDGQISDAQKDIIDAFEESLKNAFNFGYTILEKSICDVIHHVAINLKEELK